MHALCFMWQDLVPRGFTVQNVKSLGAKLRSTWRLNADRLLPVVLTELKAIFVMRKILKKLHSTVPVRELNFPTGHQSEHTGKHGCLQHEQIFLKKSEPLISMNRKIIHF